MQGSQLSHRGNEFCRKQPQQRRDHAGKLHVPLAEVAGPVQVFEKEPGSAGIPLVSQQVGVGLRKAIMLVMLDGSDTLAEFHIGSACLPLGRDIPQAAQDGFTHFVQMRTSPWVSRAPLWLGLAMMQHFGP